MSTLRELFDTMVLIGIFAFIFQISIGAVYVLNQVMVLENATDISLQGIPIFITFFPLIIPIPVTGMMLGISLAIIYLVFSLIDFKRRVDDKRPLYDVFVYGSVTLIITFIIEFIQSSIGIETGSLETENQYLFILSAMHAPIAEEIGFRLSIIGSVSALLLIIGGDDLTTKNLFMSLIHPYSTHRKSRLKTLYGLVLIQALIFGFAHLLGGGGWQMGKVSTATIAGIYLGYLYVKYGLSTSILGHGFFNIYLLGLGYLSDIGYKIGNLFISGYALIFLLFSGIIGSIYLIYMAYKLYIWSKTGRYGDEYIDEFHGNI